MSDYHVREISPDGMEAKVIFHIPIPVEKNSAGVSLRTAVSEYIKLQLDDGTFLTFQSDLQGITSGELKQLRAGELLEHTEQIGFLAADTNAQKQAKIDARYTKVAAEILNNTRAILKFWGLKKNVP